jgi:hypothetical protein
MTESHPTIGNLPTSTAAKEKEINHDDYLSSIEPNLHSNPKNLAMLFKQPKLVDMKNQRGH